MGVDVDRTGQDEEPGRIDPVTRPVRQPAKVGLDGADPSAANGDIGPPGTACPDDRAAGDDEVRPVHHPGRIPASRQPTGVSASTDRRTGSTPAK